MSKRIYAGKTKLNKPKGDRKQRDGRKMERAEADERKLKSTARNSKGDRSKLGKDMRTTKRDSQKSRDPRKETPSLDKTDGKKMERAFGEEDEKDVNLSKKPGGGSKSGLLEPLITRREKKD